MSTTIKDKSEIEGHTRLKSQKDVNEFGDYVILNSLTITGTDITDLSPLSTLRGIKGDLRIFLNHSLTSIKGLGDLRTVVGSLSIHDNQKLESFDGLEKIKHFRSSIIERNGSLTDSDRIEPESRNNK